MTFVRMWKMHLMLRTLNLPRHEEALRRVNVDGRMAAQLELCLHGVLAGYANGQLGDGPGQTAVGLCLDDFKSGLKRFFINL